MTLDDFQRAKLIEWAEWCQMNDPNDDMPAGLSMVDGWACCIVYDWEEAQPFPTRDQFAERQDAVTSEAI